MRMTSEMLSTFILIALLSPQVTLLAYFLVGVAAWLFMDDYCDRYAEPWPVSRLTGFPIQRDSILSEFVITAATWPVLPRWIIQHQIRHRGIKLPKVRVRQVKTA